MEKKSSSRYKAAVIGGGRIGIFAELDSIKSKPATHAGAFLKHAKTELVGLAEIDSEKRSKIKKLFPEIPLFDDAGELLEKTKPIIVSIATPDETHWSMVNLAVKYGARLIICEKPIATVLGDARKIINTCKRSDVILLVNHVRRFDPLLREFQEKMRAGEFGKIHQIRCLYVNGLLNSGTHAIDLIRWFVGEVVSVQGRYNKQFAFTHQGDHNVDGFLDLKNGSRVVLQSFEKNDYYIWNIEFYGSKGALFVHDLGFHLQAVPVLRGKVTAKFNELALGAAKNFGRIRSFFAPMADHAVACLDERIKPVSGGEDGLAALRVLLALRQSAEAGGKKVIVSRCTL